MVFRLTATGPWVPEGLRRVDIVMREYVGLVAYYLTGRIGSLLPGP